MDAARGIETKGKNVVACRGDGQNNIIGGYFEETGVGAVIFPRESVNVGVVETSMFG